LKDVKQRLDLEFERLQTPAGDSTVKRIIDSIDKTIQKFVDKLAAEEVAGDAEAEESNTDELDEFQYSEGSISNTEP